MNLTFTDPYSGHEILLIEDAAENKATGIVYHPRVVTPPSPWSSGCPHCSAGKQYDLRLHLRREIQMLCTRSIRNDVVEYSVPSSSQPYSLLCKSNDLGWCVRVTRPNVKHTLDVIYQPGEKTVFSGNPRSFQSTILRRCLRFLFTGRETPKNEIAACLVELVAQQKKNKIPVRGHPCKKIDWSVVRGACLQLA